MDMTPRSETMSAPPRVPMASAETRRAIAGVGALAVILGIFAALGPLDDLLGWTTLVLTTAVVSVIAWRNPAVRLPLLIAFAVRTAAVIAHTYAMPLPGSELDARTFERYGWEWSQGSFGDVMGRFTSFTYLYSWLIAVLYWLVGRSAFMIAMVNVFAGTLVVLNVHRLATLLRDEPAGRRAAWVAALFPTLILYSSLTMREMAVTLPLVYGALCFARWRRTERAVWIGIAMAAFTFASAFHAVVLGVLAAGLFLLGIRWAVSLLRGRVLTSASTLVGLGLAVMVGVIAVRSGFGYIQMAASYASLEVIQGQQEVAAVERTAYLQGLTTDSLLDLVWQFPLRLVFFLLVPFPWWLRSPVDLVGVLDSSLYAWLAWNSLRGAGFIRRDAAARAVLILAMGCLATFALVVSNYGTAIRHRGKAAPLLIALAMAASTAHEASRRRSLTDPTND